MLSVILLSPDFAEGKFLYPEAALASVVRNAVEKKLILYLGCGGYVLTKAGRQARRILDKR